MNVITQSKGFTLAELLVAMAILGIIAGFAIPKILTTLNSSNETKYKEALATISQAYQKYSLENTVSAATSFADIIQYINYSQIDTSSTFEAPSSGATLQTCSSTIPCLVLPGKTYIQYDSTPLGAVDSTHGLYVNVDTDGPAKGAGGGTVIITSEGRITSYGILFAGHFSSPTVGRGAWGGMFLYPTDPDYFIQ